MKKIVSFEADKTRNIKFGINSLINLEKQLGKSLSSLSNEAFSLENLRTILHVGIYWEDKNLTIEQTGDILDEAIDKNGIQYVSEKLGEALQSALGGKSATPYIEQ